MKLLSSEELREVEKTLRGYLPKSQQVYGFVFLINRVEADRIDVFVDRWPEFRVLLVRPVKQEENDFYKGISIFTTDEASLKNKLLQTDILDWTQYNCLSFDIGHAETVKAVAAQKGVPETQLSMCHMMILQNPSKLQTNRLSVQLSSLQEAHVDLVNRTWKFNSGKYSERLIRNMVRSYPSYCVLGSDGQPVAWILTYSYCAMGMLYTLPEHRGRGYARALISAMAQKLLSEGYPVYCYIEEENTLSYRLFQSLGFSEDPSYRVTWYSFNEALLSLR
ncbi:glycine N-acyltransferase-like protein 3 [Astyanax mexicanus]|uniref:Glycine N-acyltransferase-like protein n=1 Tax=Astyanax mexicanus TaxID=7994 RepID=A0A8T2LVI9_ASTMX|nr:glycine N-acyltransferase-like protein 3 [Astyanax mexicanus]